MVQKLYISSVGDVKVIFGEEYASQQTFLVSDLEVAFKILFPNSFVPKRCILNLPYPNILSNFLGNEGSSLILRQTGKF